MIEQWFLDLDGTRSGPYHTPEIMALIAEGEVLPHHRISISLKDQPWSNVLDWRLDQAKISQTPKRVPTYQPEVTPVDVSAIVKEPIKEPVKELEAPVASVSLPFALTPDTEPVLVEFDPPTRPGTLSDEEHEEETSTQLESLLADFRVEELAAIEPPVLSKPAPPPRQLFDLSKPQKSLGKRDPMAEMFDMLQDTKQKKESKQMAPFPVGMSIKADNPSAIKLKGGLAKTLGIGAGIVIVGFALGQLFQSAVPPATSVNLSPSPTPPTKVNPMPTAPGAPKEASSVMDRSTDKLTIRANVDRHLEVASPPAAPPLKNQLKPVTRLNTADAIQNEKEIEELKSLKKELQELKALKSNGNPGDDLNDGVLDGADGQALDPNSNFDPNNFQGPNSGIIPGGIPQNGDLPSVVR